MRKKKVQTVPELCAIVKRIRTATGDTQEKFARRIGVAVMTVSRFELGRQIPRNGRVLVELLQAARASGLEDEAAFLDKAINEHPSVVTVDMDVNFTPQEWRLMQSARIAARFYPETARAIERAAAHTLALVDEILRGAEARQRLGASFYFGLEEALDELAKRRSFEELQRERYK